jgi:hypothetical protein
LHWLRDASSGRSAILLELRQIDGTWRGSGDPAAGRFFASSAIDA